MWEDISFVFSMIQAQELGETNEPDTKSPRRDDGAMCKFLGFKNKTHATGNLNCRGQPPFPRVAHTVLGHKKPIAQVLADLRRTRVEQAESSPRAFRKPVY